MIRIFKVVVPASILALLLSEAVLITTCYIASLFVLISADPELFLLYEGGALRIGLVTAVIILGLYFSDLYSNIRVRSTFLLIQQVCLSLGIAFISQALLSYVNPELILPRWVMIYGSTLVLVLLPTWRVLYARYLVPAFGSRRFLFLGDSPALDELAEGALERPELGLSVLGYVFRTERPASESSMKYLGPMNKLRDIVRELKPDAIVVGMAERRQQLPMHDLLELRFSGVPVLEATKLYESVFGRVNTRDLRPSQLIFTEELGPNPGNVAIQTVYNFVIAAFGLVILSPVLILTAIAVRLSSPGPILLRQVRSGYQEQPYTLYKFRSMYQDAEARTGAVWASKNDPRITPIGIHLRRFRLDEIPQLFNVLKGEMAIAGPRPERPEFVQTLSEQIEFFRQRNCVKPGITGWAQINSGYSENVEDVVRKLEYDLYYIKHLSFSLDFYIYFHTLKTMVLRRGSQ
jgi:sugar transferase (PEP-CTERM system associated)